MAADKEPDIQERVLALAHQLGRLIGTVERKAHGLLDHDALNKQVTQIRDSANDLLERSFEARSRLAGSSPAIRACVLAEVSLMARSAARGRGS